jgi:hypothetical protein
VGQELSVVGKVNVLNVVPFVAWGEWRWGGVAVGGGEGGGEGGGGMVGLAEGLAERKLIKRGIVLRYVLEEGLEG